jgi:hypothetical protein
MRYRLTTPKLIAFGFFFVWACATPADACPTGIAILHLWRGWGMRSGR